jgi:hypothetical protein
MSLRGGCHETLNDELPVAHLADEAGRPDEGDVEFLATKAFEQISGRAAPQVKTDVTP